MALPHDVQALLLAVAAASGSPDATASAVDAASAAQLTNVERVDGLEMGEGETAGALVGRFLAARARLADHAVRSHRRLRDDLTSLGAHPALALWADEAAEDARTHAALLRKLAAKYGTHDRALPSRAPEAQPRTIARLAEDNAVAGCVHGTFDALVALHQGHTAEARDVAEVMARIGDDEVRHAALAFAVHSFVEPKLSDAQRARVEAARSEAARVLAAQLEATPSPDVARLAGIPSAEKSRALARELKTALFG